jgi:hypothetical protein
LRAAFATPATTVAHMNSYSRTIDNDLSFEHQHSMEQDSKHNFYISSDLDSETAPDDFILVEVVRNE